MNPLGCCPLGFGSLRGLCMGLRSLHRMAVQCLSFQRCLSVPLIRPLLISLVLSFTLVQPAIATFYRFEMKTVFLDLAGVIDTAENTMEIRRWYTRQPQFALAPDASGSPAGCLPHSSLFVRLNASIDLPDGGGEELTTAMYLAASSSIEDFSNADIFSKWYQQAGNIGGVQVDDLNTNIRFGINGFQKIDEGTVTEVEMAGFIAGLSAISGSGLVAESIYVPDFVISTPEDDEKLCGEFIAAGDTDGDLIPDSVDIDDDNDGILDVSEGSQSDTDTDGDFIPDSLDDDADGDNVPDSIEGHDADQDGVADRTLAGQDSDGDGLDDRFDPDCTGANCTGIFGVPASKQNTGGSAKPDFQDSDDDGDGFATINEQPFALDSDGDGTPDYLDADQDYDRDGDSILDVVDLDDDGDGIRDSVEGTADTDADGIIDRLDTDSDNDNVPDEIEAFDVNHTGRATVNPANADVNNNGLDDAYDTACTGSNCGTVIGIDAPLPNTDGDSLPDYRDNDDDDDGLFTSPDEDRDGDGDPTNDDVDSDGRPDYLDDIAYVTLDAKVFLQGAIEAHPLTSVPTNGLMRSDLRDTEGNSIIPLTEPYTDLADFNHVGLGGGETVLPYVFEIAGQDAIVDWVFVELRDGDHSVVATRAALLRRDGAVVDIDGQPPLIFDDVQEAEYKVAIRHRNHLGAMKAAAVRLAISPTVVDFTTLDDSAAYHYQNAQSHPAQIKLGQYHGGLNGYGPYGVAPGLEARMAMWAGNAAHRIEPEDDTSGVKELLTMQGANNDKDQIFIDIINDQIDGENTSYATNHIARGYYLGDVNMDGRATLGYGSDFRLIFLNLLTHPMNTEHEFNFIGYEQMP